MLRSVGQQTHPGLKPEFLNLIFKERRMVLRCGVAVATGRRSGRLTVRHNDASAELFSSAERDFALFDFRLEGTRGL